MENGKKIGISLAVGVLIISGGYMLSQNKPIQYGYELTSLSGGTTQESGVTTSGVIAPTKSESLAYLNSWNGIVNRERAGETKGMDADIQFIEGDIITTAKDSTAEIIFSDNSLIRMNANSRLSFVKLASEGSEVRLNEGDVWARVLKPLYDTSFFTISTSDVSAGVQGTSVRIRKTLSGTTDVAVIDSYSPNKDKEGVILKYNNPKRKIWSEQILKAETRFTYSNSGNTTNIESFSGKAAFIDPFIRENTKRDLVYIDTLAKKTKDNKNLSDRLEGELGVSAPKQEEVPVFFDEPILKKIRVSGGGTATAPTNTEHTFMMDSVRRDLSVIDTKEKVIEMKRQLESPTLKPEEKKKIEESLKSAEQEIITVRQEIKNTVEKLDSDKDGIEDLNDNCATVANPEQKDANANNIGDACETVSATGNIKEAVKVTEEVKIIVTPILPPDSDKDGIPDTKDNCPKVPNPRQVNTYGDARGDACEVKPVEIVKPPIVETIAPITPIAPKIIISGEVKIQ